MKSITFFWFCFLLICAERSSSQSLLTGAGLGGGIADNYKVNSFIFTGINTTLTTFNIINFNKPSKYNTNGGFALLIGFAQIFYCSIYSEKSETGLNWLNYSVGTVTAVIGGIRLFKKKMTQNDITMRPYMCPQINGFSLGLMLTLK